MNLLALAAIAAPTTGTGGIMKLNGAPRNLAAQANFVYDSGGASVDAWLQTSLDQGATWSDIANWHFTTAAGRSIYNLSSAAAVSIAPTDGAMGPNTFIEGLLGSWFRVKWAVAGAYGGASSLSVDVSCDQLDR